MSASVRLRLLLALIVVLMSLLAGAAAPVPSAADGPGLTGTPLCPGASFGVEPEAVSGYFRALSPDP